MVSGKYSALAGAVSREQAMAHTSANLANVNTVGYKRSMVTFESILSGARQSREAKGINYNRLRDSYTDFAPGPQRETGNQLDFAIHGSGFFKVQGPDGPLYTRRGDFQIDGNGVLRTGNGMAVLDQGNGQIQIPGGENSTLSANSRGEISAISPDGNETLLGALAVVTINDEKLLKREEHTTFSLKEGGSEVAMVEPHLAVGSLEVSNINMAQEMTDMISNMRTYETYHKVLKSYSTIGEQLNDLGSLG